MEEESRVPKKISLLKKFDIPVQRLDFSFVRKCSDVKELEKILQILRSGEEGHFPELMTFVEARLREFDPCNRFLRVQLPVLRSQYLDKEEREDIITDISEWIHKIQESSPTLEKAGQESQTIFDIQSKDIPIRGQGESNHQVTKNVMDEKGAGDGVRGERIKSWEYDKWDKFDVDEALTRLDVLELQTQEWEKVQKPRLERGGGGGVQELMKNLDKLPTTPTPPSQPAHKYENEGRKRNQTPPSPPVMDISTPSFMEEISDPDPNKSVVHPSKAKMTQKGQSQRRGRFRVEIEDVHVPF